jgi:hypothetical protein
MANDLEAASTIMGIHVLILPLIFSLLSFVPLRTFWKDSTEAASNKISFAAVIFLSWVASGAFLMALDALFTIRIG